LFQRRARNKVALAQATAESIDLTVAPMAAPVHYRRATVRGEYDSSREFIVRGRLYRGNPGVQIVTPLRIAGQDTALLVNRGFLPTPDAGPPPPDSPIRTSAAEPGTVRVEGVALDVPDAGDGHPLVSANGEAWGRLDLSQMRQRLPYPVWPYYLIAGVDSSKTREHTIRGRVLPVRVDPPPLDDGPHLSYAIQWFAIGGAALGFGIVFVRRGRREPESAPG
jgi:surfeit locus 1 family protein